MHLAPVLWIFSHQAQTGGWGGGGLKAVIQIAESLRATAARLEDWNLGLFLLLGS